MKQQEESSQRYRPTKCIGLGDRSLVESVLKAAEEYPDGFCAVGVWQEGLTRGENENLLELMAERRIIQQIGEEEEIGKKWYLPTYGGRRGISRDFFEQAIWPWGRRLGFPKRELFDYFQDVNESEIRRQGVAFLTTAFEWEKVYAYQSGLRQVAAFESGCVRGFRLDDWTEGLVLIGPFAEEINRVAEHLPGGHLRLPLDANYTTMGGDRLRDVVDMMRMVDHDLCIMEYGWLVRDHPDFEEHLSRECERGDRDGRAGRRFHPHRSPLDFKAYEYGYILGDLDRIQCHSESPEVPVDVF